MFDRIVAWFHRLNLACWAQGHRYFTDFKAKTRRCLRCGEVEHF